MKKNPWLRKEGGPQARFRLFCFPYAGGSAAAFHGWGALLPQDVEVCAVQLPGRANRIGEPAATDMPALIRTLAAEALVDDGLPFAFFGHSLGALIAFELARFLKYKGLQMPVHLFASGCDAPQYRSPPKDMHLLSDDAMVDVLRTYNGTPPEVLAHRELLALLLPTIRADFALAERYRYVPQGRLACPISVFAGVEDDYDHPDQVQGWSKETSAACHVNWFPGDHFFLNGERQAVLEQIRARLSDCRETVPLRALAETD